MRKITSFSIYQLLIIGLLLVFANGCKKDDDINISESTLTLTTTAVSGIRTTTAISGGDITSDGGATVTARGVCWSTNQTPTISDNKTTDGTGTGSFVSKIEGLSANTTYYVRAYATNSKGTGYGSTVSFTTQQGLTDSRDANVYAITTIGKQVWMAENLRYLPSVVGPDTESNSKAYYYVYGYNGTDVNAAKATANFTTYGVLYNCRAAKTACPEGWHLPNDEEWANLANYLGGKDVAGGKLKETGTTYWNIPNTGATNEAGFSGLPGGYLALHGDFKLMGDYGIWWSDTEMEPTITYGWYLYYIISDFRTSGYRNENGLSIRCIKN